MFTPTILRFDSLPSTNIEASKRATERAPEGLCVIAAEQTAGRGRLERHWVSPKGAGLYLSLVLRPQFDQAEWPLITLLAAVAVQDTLLELFGLKADIKWPNDILAGNKKLCGILAETVETPSGRAVILGIGINVKHNSFPAHLESTATSIESTTGAPAEPNSLIAPLLSTLVRYYELLHRSDGPKIIITEWSNRSTYADGKRLRIVNGDTMIEGISRGLESDGALIIETEPGKLVAVRTGDVTLLRALGQQEASAQSEST